MIAAIMQPYFFPYIGYFQLMRAVDVFVLYDDAQYMKGGWINRNRILVNGNAAWLTLPAHRASITLPINERHYLLGDEMETVKQRLRAAYSNAPEYRAVYPILCELLDYTDSNVAAFNSNLLTSLAGRLGLACKFVSSSSLDTRGNLKGQDKVIDICGRLGADCYVNMIGGAALYDSPTFAKEDILLRFLQPHPRPYSQFGATPVPSLSIIDLLMFNPIDRVRAMLEDYRLAVSEQESVW